MTTEIKSAFHWREHPSELAHYFRKPGARVTSGQKSANSQIVLPGSSKDDSAKEMLRRVKHD